VSVCGASPDSRHPEFTVKQVVVRAFGGVEMLDVVEAPVPEPAAGEVRVRLTSVGMNHADLMARRGEYRLSSGDPPFTPGLEGGGVIDAIGAGVTTVRVGDRVTLTPDAPRLAAGGTGGTYRTHYLVDASRVLPVPPQVPDEQLGALWLPYLTAWGCLVWQHELRAGQVVALPAASSSVALAAAQIVKAIGGVAVGLTTSPDKVEAIRALPSCRYDHLVVTHDANRAMRPWHRDLKPIAASGIDVFFDPVASGAYLDTEIRCLAQHGCVWVYGLLGDPGPVDVTPLIRKHAAIRGWALSQLVTAGESAWRPGCRWILDRFADGTFSQHVGGTFALDDVRRAHEVMEQSRHIGKLVLLP
jgi:NADPH2:quinone reductase